MGRKCVPSEFRLAVEAAMKVVGWDYARLAQEIGADCAKRIHEAVGRPGNRPPMCFQIIERFEKEGVSSFELWRTYCHMTGRFDFLKSRDSRTLEVLAEKAAFAVSKGKAGVFDVID